jgi:hypothetical protein
METTLFSFSLRNSGVEGIDVHAIGRAGRAGFALSLQPEERSNDICEAGRINQE